MKKFVCTVCGYVYEGEAAPAECPVCHAPAEKFKEQTGDREWAAEHVVGVAQGVSEDILADLRANFEGECSEVGMYRSVCTGRKLLTRKLSTLLNSLSCSVRSLQTAQRRTLRCVLRQRTALQQENLILQNVRKQLTLTQSTIPYTRWLETRLVTEKHSRDF